MITYLLLMPVFILVKCGIDSCSRFQVQQKRGVSTKPTSRPQQWSCKVCRQKQSVVKVYCESRKAKDCRLVCMELSARQGARLDAERAAWREGSRDESGESDEYYSDGPETTAAAAATAAAAEGPVGAEWGDYVDEEEAAQRREEREEWEETARDRAEAERVAAAAAKAKRREKRAQREQRGSGHGSAKRAKQATRPPVEVPADELPRHVHLAALGCPRGAIPAVRSSSSSNGGGGIRARAAAAEAVPKGGGSEWDVFAEPSASPPAAAAVDADNEWGEFM